VPTPGRMPRPTLAGWTYALIVTVVATLGFTTGSTSTILLGAFVALPSSAVTLPAYYLAYGLLAQIPGANPSSSAGSASCAPSGECQASTTGDPAAWFTLATEVIGLVALTIAACLNVVVLRGLIAARRTRAQTPTPPGR
jgi:hypothetical protein